ncbi:MAG: site-specific DNA-methyltransferase [Quinella sp. 1Q7]|nr:site-specific DNA-methyltransferase [Quinella sp. 1Q7]
MSYEIFNEDCLEGMKTLADGSVDLIATDPSYCVGVSSNG